MNNKQLIINMAANIIAFLVNMGIGFIFTPYLINTVGTEAYSFFPLANNFISYASILTIALNSMASRFITIKIHQDDIEGANEYFNSVLLSNTILAALLSIPSILLVVFVDKVLNVPVVILKEVQNLFGFVFWGTILSILTSVFGVATFAKNRLDLSSKRSIEANIIRVILLGAFFKFLNPSISYIGVVNVIVVIYVMLTNIHYTKKLLPEINLDITKFKFRAVKELLSSGIWNSINQLSVVLLTGLDLLIANMFLGTSVSAEYAIVKTVPNFIQSLVAMLVGVFVPRFTILYAKNKQEELIDSIMKSIKFMGITITIPISFLLVFGDRFYSLWVPGQDINNLYMLSNLTLLPMIVTGSINTIFNVYSVTNKLKTPALILLTTGILNTSIVLVLLSITNLGLVTIPLVALVIGLIRNLLFTPIYAAKCLNVKWTTFYKSIFKGSICSLTMIIVGFIIKSCVNVDSWISLILVGITSSIITITINVFAVLTKKERSELFSVINKIKNR